MTLILMFPLIILKHSSESLRALRDWGRGTLQIGANRSPEYECLASCIQLRSYSVLLCPITTLLIVPPVYSSVTGKIQSRSILMMAQSRTLTHVKPFKLTSALALNRHFGGNTGHLLVLVSSRIVTASGITENAPQHPWHWTCQGFFWLLFAH